MERLPVEIDVYCQNVCQLSKILKQSHVKFDRIDVGNMSDENYIGINRILADWVPLLNRENKNSTLITLFTTWLSEYDNLHELGKRLLHKYGTIPERVRKMNCDISVIRAHLDESATFNNYLSEKVIPENCDVQKRKVHKIVPHRLFTPIKASETYTFGDATDEEFYYAVCLSKSFFNERYVEWCFE